MQATGHVHTEEQRVFIVRRLAVFDAQEEIQADFKRRWPTTACEAGDIAACDPRRGLTDEKLLAIFNARRKNFVEDFTNAAPTAEQSVRLIELHNMYRLARDRNALSIAADLLEQIAKEQAGFYASKSGGKAAPLAPGEQVEEITRITWTVVDPKESTQVPPAAAPAA